LEARIVAVADVFQALAQTRPYRDSMSSDEIMGILNGMVDEGKLDREVVMCVDHHHQDCCTAAIADGTVQ